MNEILVLGIGNTLMADDGIGVYVVEELNKRNTNPDIIYITGETDIYFCKDKMDEASYIFIVDAAFLGNKPGTVSIVPLQKIYNNCMHLLSGHDYSILNDITLTDKDFYGMFIGIEPFAVNYSPGLSSFLTEQFTRIVEEVENALLSRILKFKE